MSIKVHNLRFLSRSFALRLAAGLLVGSAIVLPVVAQEDETMPDGDVPSQLDESPVPGEVVDPEPVPAETATPFPTRIPVEVTPLPVPTQGPPTGPRIPPTPFPGQ